jgi:NAD(P)H-dependent FMN reductase
MIVLGLSGGLRRGSYNRALLRATASAPPPGVRLEPWDDLGAVPPYRTPNKTRPMPSGDCGRPYARPTPS